MQKSRIDWALSLKYIPGVNLIALPLLSSLAAVDMTKAIAKEAESEVQGAAALVVAETLIPALSNFIGRFDKSSWILSKHGNGIAIVCGKYKQKY